ncbi:MAG: ABC transporter permease [Elainellaceae cyanobacterium]
MKIPSISLWGVYSVWHRHARVYQRTWLVNFLPPITEPIVYLIAFGLGLTPLVGEVIYNGQPVTYLEFIAPGMIALGVLFQSFFEGAFGSFIRLNFQRTWHALLTAPLSFGDVFVGDWLWATTKGMITGTLTGVVAILWGIYSPLSLLIALPFMLLGSLLFACMGLIVAGAANKVDHINIPIFGFVIPMFTLCGTYFPRETLPGTLRAIANVLPLASLVDLLRFPMGLPQWWWADVLWLVVLTLISAALAVRMIRPKLIH